MLSPDAEGCVLIPVINPTLLPVRLQPGEHIGQAELLDEKATVQELHPKWTPPECDVHHVDAVSPAEAVVAPSPTIEERKRELATILAIPKESITDRGAQELLDCVMRFHDVLALEEGERGEVKGVEYTINTEGAQPI